MVSWSEIAESFALERHAAEVFRLEKRARINAIVPVRFDTLWCDNVALSVFGLLKKHHAHFRPTPKTNNYIKIDTFEIGR